MYIAYICVTTVLAITLSPCTWLFSPCVYVLEVYFKKHCQELSSSKYVLANINRFIYGLSIIGRFEYIWMQNSARCEVTVPLEERKESALWVIDSYSLRFMAPQNDKNGNKQTKPGCCHFWCMGDKGEREKIPQELIWAGSIPLVFLVLLKAEIIVENLFLGKVTVSMFD